MFCQLYMFWQLYMNRQLLFGMSEVIIDIDECKITGLAAAFINIEFLYFEFWNLYLCFRHKKCNYVIIS